MRVWGLLVCVSLLCLAVAGEGRSSSPEEAAVLPGNPLARGCGGDQLGPRNVYVSTIDGGLTALDVEEGRTLWTYHTNTPLFFSSFSPSENDGVTDRIIPGLDRGMYHWDGHRLAQLPFTADDLIDHTHFLKGRGSIVAGAKANNVVGVNIHTGKPIYECSHEKCHRYDNRSLIQRMDVLKLSTSRVTVREASDLTGEELWNFTVGGMQLMLVEGEEPGEGGGGHSCGFFQELRWKLHADMLRGVVYATDRANSDPNLRVWEVELGVPVVRAWLHEGGKLEPISLTSPSHASGHIAPSLMMVHYANQYYLQPVEWEGQGMWLEMEAKRAGGVDKSASEVDEGTVVNMFSRHYSLHADMVATNHAAEEKGLMLYYDQDTFSEMCTQGPYGLAVYFYSDLLTTPDYNKKVVEENNSESSQTVCSLPSESTPYQEPSWLQWMVPKLWSAVKYMLFGGFVLACNKLRRLLKSQRQRHRNSSTSSSTSSSVDFLDDDEFPPLDLMKRRHSSSESAHTLQRTPSLPTVSSTETMVPYSRANSVPEPRVLPRFGSDYELKGRLGKGGFGVVYHVQNKTDGGEYALKRIKLPSNKAAREKVMREVRALAQLDHPRIVRYFNSWVEKAPTGWNEMEEWMPLSRRASYIKEQGSNNSTAPPPPSIGVSSPSSSLHPPHSRGGGHTTSLSPCPSFNSLNHSAIHSTLPPLRTTDSDSKSGSFVIEFRDESDQQATDSVLSDSRHRGGSSSQLLSGQNASDLKPANGLTLESKNGCFRSLLRNRDDLSLTDTSQSSQHKEERRDSIADLGAEPPTYLFIQMQLCRKESLKDWLTSNISSRCHGKVMHFFDQILDAVRYVHRKGMMHRDLKPSNIFFSLDGTIKVGDFGLVTSSVYGGLRNSYLVLKGLGEEEQHKQHTGNLGTHFYMSPEQMSGHKYDHKVDIYSLGVIFFELHYPFQTKMERAKVLEDVRKHKFPASFEAKLPRQAELVKWLMAHHASDRPVVEDIYNSNTFKQLQENLMETIPKL